MGSSLEKKKIVVSAINFTEGGPLSILKDCLSVLESEFADRYEIIALIHSKKGMRFDKIKLVEFPYSKRSWLFRIYYEYIYFYFLSRRVAPHLWLSLHDITPNVKADIRAVYCHNPSPFYKIRLWQASLDPKFFLFNIFYRYLYAINIKKNDYVIVQQSWLKRKFIDFFGVCNVIVSHPSLAENEIQHDHKPDDAIKASLNIANDQTLFIYPAFPRVFKNIELIGEAVKILRTRKINNYKVIVTVQGDENRYAKNLFKKYGSFTEIGFAGQLSRDSIFAFFNASAHLIFPSTLETWGLPLTEGKLFGNTIIAADLPYAHETLGNYKNVRYIDPQDAMTLANAMQQTIAGASISLLKPDLQNSDPGKPLVGWKDLFGKLLNIPQSS
jgi:glycosyltransferase involved in cell wall biosynthesis